MSGYEYPGVWAELSKEYQVIVSAQTSMAQVVGIIHQTTDEFIREIKRSMYDPEQQSKYSDRMYQIEDEYRNKGYDVKNWASQAQALIEETNIASHQLKRIDKARELFESANEAVEKIATLWRKKFADTKGLTEEDYDDLVEYIDDMLAMWHEGYIHDATQAASEIIEIVYDWIEYEANMGSQPTKTKSRLPRKHAVGRSKAIRASRVGDYASVSDMDDRYELVDRDYDVESIVESYTNHNPRDFGYLFVLVGDAEFEEIWGGRNSVPYLDSEVKRLA